MEAAQGALHPAAGPRIAMLEPELFELLEHTADAAWSVTETGEILSWNAAAAALFGYARNDVLHRNVAEVLTARDAVDDRVRGLDLGADDYMPKPFALPELAAQNTLLLPGDLVVGEGVLPGRHAGPAVADDGDVLVLGAAVCHPLHRRPPSPPASAAAAEVAFHPVLPRGAPKGFDP